MNIIISDWQELDGLVFKKQRFVVNSDYLVIEDEDDVLNYVIYSFNSVTAEELIAVLKLKGINITYGNVIALPRKFGNIELCQKTILTRPVRSDEIEICLWGEDFKWVVANFRYDIDYRVWYIESYGDRLNNPKINWEGFGKAVEYGYKYLNGLN